ncbi:GxxExxY protein [Membranicola marinus]|uniref:GxxExxY protein n=1 Tax=Membranihabitans marinus TaxID=1227546 RepID=A0A953LDZ6_9BACT|nr:GxxExxY protein [Membranihabitans marinus]MBY5959414.1 GxxExxY protein [Membranihabitans marinus]
MKKQIDDKLTYMIIGCAMKVHNKLGCGFPEKIYQKALAIEMTKEGLKFDLEMSIPIYYHDVKLTTRRVDFFVQDKVMVELKAIFQLENGHLNQAMNYCEACNLPYGLLINFGAKSLEYKRVYNLNHPDNKTT